MRKYIKVSETDLKILYLRNTHKTSWSFEVSSELGDCTLAKYNNNILPLSHIQEIFRLTSLINSKLEI